MQIEVTKSARPCKSISPGDKVHITIQDGQDILDSFFARYASESKKGIHTVETDEFPGGDYPESATYHLMNVAYA